MPITEEEIALALARLLLACCEAAADHCLEWNNYSDYTRQERDYLQKRSNQSTERADQRAHDLTNLLISAAIQELDRNGKD